MRSLLPLLSLEALSSSSILPSESECYHVAQSVSLSQYNATALNATYYPANSLNVTNVLNQVPLCEIYGSTSYGNNDTLIFVIWLPEVSTYADRFLAVGNGGMAGTIDLDQMMAQLNSGLGLAVAGGNAGHLASYNNNGGGAPGVYLPYLHDEDQVNAWIHDAISLFTPAAERLTTVYYKKAPKHAYYYGCSTGGAQGYALAQFHPDLFDGIYAGCPGNWYSHLALSFLWNAQQTSSSASNLSQAQLNLTTNAVLDACDKIDGVQDRLIEDPLRCDFDIDTLACDSQDSDGIECLTKAEIASVKAIYAGPKRFNDGSQLYPGFSFGSEISWLLQEGALANAFSIPILQNLVFNNLEYDSYDFNWASDVEILHEKAGTFIDEISPNLSAFRKHGGKFLTSQGWADPFNAATWPIEHRKQIEDFFSGNIDDFYNLFMIPGGGHCGAAQYYPSVPAKYHVVPALIDWVEKGMKPNEILSTDPADGGSRSRKLCAWPATAKYVGGDVNDWESYECQ